MSSIKYGLNHWPIEYSPKTSQISQRSNLGSISKKHPSKIQFEESKSNSQKKMPSLSSLIRDNDRGNCKQEEYVKIDEYEVQQIVEEIKKTPYNKVTRKTSRHVGSALKSKLSQCKSHPSLANYGGMTDAKETSNFEQRDSRLIQAKGLLKDLNPVSFMQNSNKRKSAIKNNKSQSIINQSHLQQSVLESYLKQQSEQDIINRPDLSPKMQSFHLDDSKSIDYYDIVNKMSFKEALELKNQGLFAHHKELGLIQNDLFCKNILKSPRGGQQQNQKFNDFVHLSSAKKSFSSQSKTTSHFASEESKGGYFSVKNEELLEMQSRLRELEREKKTMQMKLLLRDNQIRELRSGSFLGSEKNVQFSATPTESNFWQHRESSLHTTGRMRGQSLFQREIQAAYRPYLDHFKGNTFRKNLIRPKCLAYNSEYLQIGCLSQLLHPSGQNDGTLTVTFFITLHLVEAFDFSIFMQHDDTIKSTIQPYIIERMRPKKQYKMVATLAVQRIPFQLPQMEVNFKVQSEYNPQCLKMTLPVAFNKFVQIKPFHAFERIEGDPNYKQLRTNEFMLNSKNFPFQKIEQYMSSWNSKRLPGVIYLGSLCAFLNNRFYIRATLHEKSSFIEGWLLQGDKQAVQFFVCTLKQVFSSHKK